MSRLALLGRPHWRPFLHLPGFGELSTPALLAADGFFTFVAEFGLADPQPQDIVRWVATSGAADRVALLDHLAAAIDVCIPPFAARVNEARRLVPRAAAVTAPPQDRPPSGGAPFTGAPSRAPEWDPIAPPARKPPRSRSVSVQPSELPQVMQVALRRMAMGIPQHHVVLCRPIAVRMREKLCQFVWSARQAGLEPVLSEAAVERYVADLMERGRNRDRGVRWATLRASMEELHRYARYVAEPAEVRERLARQLAQFEARERLQKALKFFQLAWTGNTTDSVLDLADSLAELAATEACRKRRHRLRNGACMLGIYPVAPLRPGSAELVFGETLFWRHDAWVIETAIRKTQARNPEPFVMRLQPQHGRFIDMVLLGDQHPRYLPQLREEAIAARRQLFVLPDGGPTAPTYIPRIYKALTGNSLGTTRTMLHTGLATDLGTAGRDMAMVATHHSTTTIARKYQAESVAIAAVARRQAAGSARRARYELEPMPDLS